MSLHYDVIVIGGGPAGEHCAGALAEGGLRVAVVEHELVGGECSYWACIPSKTLLRPGQAARAAREAAAKPATCCAAGLRPPVRSRSMASATPPGTSWSRRARSRSCRRCRACASSTASGAREATGMKVVPRRLLVLGGGTVGVEIAQAVRGFGGEVVVVDGGERVLAREPAPLGEALGAVLRREGVELVLGTRVAAARREGEDYVLALGDGREVRGDGSRADGSADALVLT